MATNDENARRVEKYVEAKVSGLEPREAARVAGYSDKSKITDIERVGGPVHNLMCNALSKKGINEDWLAGQYADGIELSKSSDAKDADCNAHAKYLLQLGYLLGYGKQGPSVAVQINNNAGDNPVHEPGRIEDTLREVGELLQVVRTELGARQTPGIPIESDGLAGGDILPPQAETHQ